MREETSKKDTCPCPYKLCERNGNCEECLAYHKSLGESTYCGKE
jgi:hypothetical protein